MVNIWENILKQIIKLDHLNTLRVILLSESRFGSSIRFGCYVDLHEVDRGTSTGHGESYDSNLGNPMILIRNRQKVTVDDETKYQYNILRRCKS